MASRTDPNEGGREPGQVEDNDDREPRVSRRGLFAGAAGLAALLFGRRQRFPDPEPPAEKRRGRLPWIGHY